MNIADLERFEQKLREAETKLGIKPGYGVPVVYDRSLNAPELILFVFLAGLLALAYFGRSKGAKSPISFDMFVSIFSYISIYNYIYSTLQTSMFKMYN